MVRPRSSSAGCGALAAALSLVLVAHDARASDAPDVVVLRNGGFVRGQVLEHDPDKGTTVLLADGTTKRYSAAEIGSVRLGGDATLAPPPAAAPPSAAPAPAARPEEGEPLPPPPGPKPEDDTRTANNALFVELGGNGIAYSVNYERHVSESFVLRVGTGLWGSVGESPRYWVLTVPATASFLVGSPTHKFELGGGITGVASSNGTPDRVTTPGVFGSAIVGYRYNPPKAGFFFKIAMTPLFGDFGFIPSLGASFGAGF
jgi:hypothetical protein